MHVSVASDGGLGGALEFALERDIGAHALDVGVGRPQPLKGLVQSVLFDIAHHHLDARLGESGGNSQADS